MTKQQLLNSLKKMSTKRQYQRASQVKNSIVALPAVGSRRYQTLNAFLKDFQAMSLPFI